MLIVLFLLLLQKHKKMKVVKFSEILKKLYADGWYLKHQKGSHRQLVHPTKKGKVTVNGKESDDVYGSLLKSIENQSGLKF